MRWCWWVCKPSLVFSFGPKLNNSARFYLNFPTGKLFGKLSFLQNFSGGAHLALKHRYITLHFRAKRIQNSLIWCSKSSKQVLNFPKIFLLVLRDFVWKLSEISSESFNYVNYTNQLQISFIFLGNFFKDLGYLGELSYWSKIS